MNVADIYRPYVVILALWEFDHLSLFSLVKLIHVQSIYALVILILSYPNGFYFFGVIASCYFWWMICFSPIKSLSSESRDEILFRGKAVTVHVLAMLDIYFVSVKYVFVSLKLMCVFVKFLKI
jgi:hypothetical protein